MPRFFSAWFAAAVTIMVTAFVPAARAQAPSDLITDRPDFTESPIVVPLGSVQLETGATWERDGDLDVVGGPEALLRWTVVPRIELRLVVPNYITTGSASGLGDAGLGAKVAFGTMGGWQVAGIAGTTLPTGETGLSSEHFEPALVITAGRGLGASWSLGLQASTAWQTGTDEVALAATLVAGTAVSEQLGTFFEAAASTPTTGPVALLLHHGYTLSLGSLMQLDVHVGAGVSDAAPDFLVGAGWSGRF